MSGLEAVALTALAAAGQLAILCHAEERRGRRGRRRPWTGLGSELAWRLRRLRGRR